MLKKLIWLGILALIGVGVYAIGPYVAGKYNAYIKGETAEIARGVNESAQEAATPASSGTLKKTRELEQRMNELERNPYQP